MREKYCEPDNAPILIGGSLGGYMAMEAIRKYPKRTDFAGAVIGMASQNVGLGRSFKASVGLFMIEKGTQLMSTETMGKYFLKMAKNVDREVLVELG